MGTQWTLGCMETFLSPEVFLLYPQSPLLSGPSILRDIPTPEYELLLLLQERPLPCLLDQGPLVPAVLLFQSELSSDSEESQDVGQPVSPPPLRHPLLAQP